MLVNVLLSYAKQVLKAARKLITENKVNGITIHGLERLETWELDGRNFIGFIDRLDSIRPLVLRFLDYKTGKTSEDEVYIDDGNAA